MEDVNAIHRIFKNLKYEMDNREYETFSVK